MARADRARALFGLHPRGSALDRGSCCGHSHLARLFPVLPHRREIWSGAAGGARRDPRLARGARPSPRNCLVARDEMALAQAARPPARTIRLCALAQNASALASCTLRGGGRSEEHTSELQSLMRISYAVFCLKKKNNHEKTTATQISQQQ